MIRIYHGYQFDKRKSALQKELIDSFLTESSYKQLVIVPTNRWETRFKEEMCSFSTSSLIDIPVYSFAHFIKKVYEIHRLKTPDLIHKEEINRSLKLKFLEDILISQSHYLHYYQFDGQNTPKQGTLYNLLSTIDDLILSGYSADSFRSKLQSEKNLSIKQSDFCQIFSLFEVKVMKNFFDDQIIQRDLDIYFNPEFYKMIFPTSQNVVFFGFDKFSKLMVKTIQKLKSVYVDFSIQINGDLDNLNLMQHTRKSLSLFESFDSIQYRKSELEKTNEAVIKFEQFDTFDQEINEIIDKVLELNKHGYSLDKIAIAFPNTDRIASQLRIKLNARLIPFNISAGLNLFESNLIKFFCLLFKLQLSDFLYKDILRFFKSPYISLKKPFPEHYFIKLCERYRQYSSIDKMIEKFSETEDCSEKKVLLNCLTKLQKQLKVFAFKAEKPEAIVDRFKRILNTYQLKEALIQTSLPVQLIEHDVKAYYRFFEMLNQLIQSLGAVKPKFKLTLADFYKLMENSIRETNYQLTQRRNLGVQIVPLLECRSESPKVIFLAGLNQSVFPKAIEESQFMTESEMIEMELDQDSERIAEDRYILSLLLAKETDHCFLSAHMSYQGQSDYVSSLVDELKITHQFQDWKLDNSKKEEVLNAQGGSNFQLDDDINLKQLWNNKVYSATELDNYQSCPYQYYARRVLKFHSIDDIDDELPNYSKGNFIHQVLYHFHLKNGHLLSTIKEKLALMKEIAKVVLESNEFKTISIFWQADIDNYLSESGILEKYLTDDIEQFANFKPLKHEWEFGSKTGESESGINCLTLKNDTNEIQLQGKIDRIDIDENGNFLVIDYKTGKNIKSSNDIAKFKSFQLPIYLLAVSELTDYLPAGAIYYQIAANRKVEKKMIIADREHFDVSRGSRAFLPSASFKTDSNSQLTFSEFLESVKNEIMCVHQKIIDKQFKPNPSSLEECRYCDYKTMCRLEEISMS